MSAGNVISYVDNLNDSLENQYKSSKIKLTSNDFNYGIREVGIIHSGYYYISAINKWNDSYRYIPFLHVVKTDSHYNALHSYIESNCDPNNMSNRD